MIKVKLLNEKAKAPKQGTPGSAGLDLYATDHAIISPGAHVKIPTGVAVQIPGDHAGFIWPRSGLATKHGFDLLAGLVDSDYRGEIHVCGINHGDQAIEIHPGDRIAQLVVGPVMTLIEVCENLDDPKTRAGGFGSTGV